MMKFKVFLGTINEKADEKFNKWLEQNKNIEIINFQFQQARYGDHSICIMYKEN